MKADYAGKLRSLTFGNGILTFIPLTNQFSGQGFDGGATGQRFFVAFSAILVFRV
jgi:hypothetical protein